MDIASSIPAAASAPEEVLDQLLRQIITGFFVLTDGQGSLSKWSEPAELLFDLAAEEALGEPFFGKLVDPAGLSAAADGWRAFLELGEVPGAAGRVEVDAVHPHGGRFPMEAVFVPVKLDEGFDFSLFLEDLSFELPIDLMLLRMRQQHPVVVKALRAALADEQQSWEGYRTAGTLVAFRPLVETPWMEAALRLREEEAARAEAELQQRIAAYEAPGVQGSDVYDLEDARAVIDRLKWAIARIEELDERSRIVEGAAQQAADAQSRAEAAERAVLDARADLASAIDDRAGDAAREALLARLDAVEHAVEEARRTAAEAADAERREALARLEAGEAATAELQGRLEAVEHARGADVDALRAELGELRSAAATDWVRAELDELRAAASTDWVRVELDELRAAANTDWVRTELSELRSVASTDWVRAELDELRTAANTDWVRSELDELRTVANTDALRAELAHLRAVAEDDGALRAATAELHARLNELEHLRGDLDAVRAGSGDAERALDERVDELQRRLDEAPPPEQQPDHTSTLEALQHEVASLRSTMVSPIEIEHLHEAIAPIADLRTDLKATRTDIHVLREDKGVALDALTARLDAVEASAGPDEHVIALTGRLEAIAAELGDARSQTGDTRDALEQRLADVGAELMAARTDAEATRRGLDELRGEIAGLREEAAAARAETASAPADTTGIDELRTELLAAVAAMESHRQGFEEARQAAVAARRDAEAARKAAERLGAASEANTKFTEVWKDLLTSGSRPALDPFSRPAARVSAPAKEAPPERPAREGFDDDPRPLAVLDLNGKFKELNPAFSKLVGYREHEFGKATWPSVLDRAVYKDQMAELEAVLSGELQAATVQSSYMHGQGLMVPVVGRVELVRDEAGEPASLLLTAEPAGPHQG